MMINSRSVRANVSLFPGVFTPIGVEHFARSSAFPIVQSTTVRKTLVLLAGGSG